MLEVRGYLKLTSTWLV